MEIVDVDVAVAVVVFLGEIDRIRESVVSYVFSAFEDVMNRTAGVEVDVVEGDGEDPSTSSSSWKR
jgi:hypothetical protein